MNQTILNHAPENWRKSSTTSIRLVVSPNTQEYKDILNQVKDAVTNYVQSISLERNQNIEDLAQLLIREQLLLAQNPNERFYRVRRFIKVSQNYLETALKHNVDYRRCGLAETRFKKSGIAVGGNDVLLIVQVVTDSATAGDIVPKNSSDYFIEYIVKL